MRKGAMSVIYRANRGEVNNAAGIECHSPGSWPVNQRRSVVVSGAKDQIICSICRPDVEKMIDRIY